MFNNSDIKELSELISKEKSLFDALGELGKRDALLHEKLEHEVKLKETGEKLLQHQSVIAVREKYRQLREEKMALDKEVIAEKLSLRALELKLRQLVSQSG